MNDARMDETAQNNSYSYYADGSLNYAYMGSDVYYYSNNNRGNRTMNYFRDSDTVYHYTYSSYTTGNRISSAYSYDSDTGSTNKYNVTSYTYDANGNTLNTTVDGVTKTRSYSKRNEVTGYTDGGNSANNATYTYGADGLRTGKTVNGTKTTYIWSGGNIVAEITGEKYVVYLYGLNRISRGILGTKYTYDGAEYDRYHELYLYDGHGNVVQTADEGIIDYLNAVHYGSKQDVAPEMDLNGDKRVDVMDLSLFLQTYPIINSYHYDAFGNQLDENTSSNTNPFRYCGEYWDSETGDIYLRARYYNPGTGRFTTVDPAMDGVNWYVYCKGNPIAFVDPWGLVPLKILNYDELSEQQKINVSSAADAVYGGYISQEDYEANLTLNGAKYNSAIVTYNPDEWNSTYMSERTNCYTYAFNMTVDQTTGRDFMSGDEGGSLFAMQPGMFSGNGIIRKFPGTEEANTELVNAITADAAALGYTFVNVNDVKIQPSGTWKVALTVSPGRDYHWFRLDDNNRWSHKRGATPVGVQIEDPISKANELGYTTTIGFFYVGPIGDTSLLRPENR